MAKGSKKKGKKNEAGGATGAPPSGEGKKASKGKKGKGKKGFTNKQNMELAKKRAEQEAQERERREAELQAIAEKKMEIERTEREGQLTTSASCIYTFDKWVLGRIDKNRELQEWRTFVACRNVPNFVKLSEVNAYLEYWRCQLEKPNMKTLLKLAPELLQVISELQEFLQLPAQCCSMDMVAELGLLYHDMIQYQNRYMDKCTYAILQDLSDLYDPEVGIFEYLLSIPQLTHCLWGNMFQCPDYDEHNFQEVQFQFKIPEALVTVKGVYRLIKTEFDHYSASCMSYFPPAVDNALKRSIQDWIEKNDIRSGTAELASPEERGSLAEVDKTKSKAGKKKKKGKKDKGSKKGKKGKKKGKSDTDSEYDEETRQLMKELDEDDRRRKRAEKRAKKGSKKGGSKKKGKKGKGGKGSASHTEMETDDTEADFTTDDEPEKEKAGKKKKEKVQKQEQQIDQADETDVGAPKETKEERRARRRKEAEEADDKEFEFQADETHKKKKKAQDGAEDGLKYDDDSDTDVKKKKRDSDSDSDQEKKKKAGPAGAGAAPGEGPTGKEKGKGKGKGKSKSVSQMDLGGADGAGDGDDKAGKKSMGADAGGVDISLFDKDSAGDGKKKGKSKSGSRKKKSKGKKKKKKGSKKKKKKSKKKKGKKSKGSKGKRGGSRPARTDDDEEEGDEDDDDESTGGKKGRGRSGGKGSKGGSKGKQSERGRSPGKKGADKKGSKKGKKGGKKGGESSSKSAKGSKKGKGKGKGGSKGGKKKGKGKDKSKSKSKSPKGKRKGKKGKKGKSKSRERPKTEAELAKERERKEKAKFIPPLHESELNLRMNHILGGTYTFQLLQIPPQPNGRGVWTIHLKEYDCSLKEVSFEADFTPPPPPDMDGGAKKTPEEMEKEAKKQEEELQKLALATLTIPDLSTIEKLSPEEEAARQAELEAKAKAAFENELNQQYSLLLKMECIAPKKILWFEPPIPVRWDPLQRYWTQDGFYDVKFDERTLRMSFRTAKFGTFGLGHNRWLNLPYQTWELRPLGKNKVLFALTASMAVLEFIIHGDLVCVSNIDNVTNAEEVREAILNKFMQPYTLIKTLRSHNLDVFPDIDSYAYVDGILTKNYETEDHLYQGMAVAATAFNFQWSRWNLLAGREKLIYQIRERHGTSSPGNYQMVLTTPRKCVRIDCTEVSPNYSETPVEEFEYQADLLNLVKNIGTPEALNIIAHTNPHHVETVRIILTSVRPLTFS